MLRKGDTVVMHTCGEAEHYEGQLWICETDEFKSSSGTMVVFLEGFSGYFTTKYLQKVNVHTSDLQQENKHLRETLEVYE
jgi:hypothetical protein